MAGQQKTLFSPDQRRKWAWRIKTDIVSAARLPPALKSVLFALWECCGDNRFCWPSLQWLAGRVGYQWPGSRRALQLKLKELESRRLIVIESGERPDGSRSSNKYRILWGNLKRTGAVCSPAFRQSPRPCGPLIPPEGETTNKAVARRVQGALVQAPPRAQASAPPRLPERPPASGQAPLETPYRPIETPTTPKVGQSRRTDGGGDFGKEKEKQCGRPSGHWAWKLKRSDLDQQEEMLRLFDAAAKAGYLEQNLVSQVRFLALLKTIKASETILNVTGYLVAIVEKAQWNYLDPEAIDRAYRQIKPQGPALTSEQKARIRGV